MSAFDKDPLPSQFRTGWVYDPEGARRFARSLSHGPTLAAAAPHLMGDGEDQDLMPYLAFYESEIMRGDGTVWKQKKDPPPYVAQVGNNCTSRGDTVCMDLFQCMDAATVDEGEADTPVPYRTCAEATYAFSLAEAGMRGDSGCTGHATAKTASAVGRVTYRDLEGPDEEDRPRLLKWANDPGAVTEALRDKAAPYRLGEAVGIRTVREAKAWLANRGLITVASGVGFETPRDAKGVCEARGQWMHQMAVVGYLCSDGVKSFVIAQSWGPDQPKGPLTHGMPPFCFRAREEVVAKMLAWDDSWGHRKFHGFARTPLPARWTGVDWSGGVT